MKRRFRQKADRSPKNDPQVDEGLSEDNPVENVDIDNVIEEIDIQLKQAGNRKVDKLKKFQK